jgi:glutamate decarboxylase
MLHKHVDTEDMIRLAKMSSVCSHFVKPHNVHTLAYGSRYATEDIPKYKLPEKSAGAQATYQLIHDELELDGRPNMNLASFGTSHRTYYN